MDALRLRIEMLMRERGRSARSLSLAIGQNSAYIQQLITGMRNKKPPSIEIMEAIADELGVSLAELRGAVAREEQDPKLSDAELMLRLGYEPVEDHDLPPEIEDFALSALRGRGNLIPQNYDDMRPKRKPKQKRAEPRVFRVRISGDCMHKTVHDGEIVWFDTELPREPVALVMAVKDEHEGHIKRLVWRDGERWLESDDGWATRVDEHWRITAVGFTAQRMLPIG